MKMSANYPINVWVLSREQFDSFTITGGKVIYIAEDIEPEYLSHPAIVTAGALLPPIEAIRLELDGMMEQSSAIYFQYLQSQEADQFISILLAAAVQNIPIGIMFGRDEMEMQFPKMFINFLFHTYGMILGVIGAVQPHFITAFMPIVLSKLYSTNIIDAPALMQFYPEEYPIHPSIVSKLAYDLNPPIKDKDLQHYAEYLEQFKNNIKRASNVFLEDPLIGSL